MDQLKERLGSALIENEPLSKHTTFKIGGPARYFVNGTSVEIIKKAHQATQDLKIPFFILGNGSNILVADKGYDGMVIKIENQDFAVDGATVNCGAGLPLAQLAKKTVDAGLTGAEWVIVIPGSVGGSIRGNAGAYGSDFSQITDLVVAFDGKEEKVYDHSAIGFGYRNSAFKQQKKGELILSAVLNLKIGVKAEAKKTMMAHLQKKNTEHPMGLPSAGCVFKNVELIPGSYVLKDPMLGQPSGFFKSEVPEEFIEKGIVPAGFLIEALDLKGFTIGGIQVSPKHANYLVNIGNATSENLVIMTSVIRQKIRVNFGIQLKEEIQLVGF